MVFMKGHRWLPTPWKEVGKDADVRTKDGKYWRVIVPWDGARVLLKPTTDYGLPNGPAVPVPLVDGSKTVEVREGIPVEVKAEPPIDPWTKPLPPLPGPHEFRPGNNGECRFGDCRAPMDDPIHTPPPFVALAAPEVEQVGTVLDRLTDEDRAALDAITPATEPDPAPVKFGQPVGSAEPDDEGRAVAALAASGLEPELIAVEDETGVKVPRELDTMALRSHLFLMHGKFYDAQDVERDVMSADHKRAHEQHGSHSHVSREELS